VARIMYDSNRPSAIPRNARMVAGYVDGLYRWSAADWALFPDAVRVEITALGLDIGTVLNLEPNGYWPSDLGVGWVQRARRRGVDPSIYCNYRNHLHLVRAAFDRAKVPHPNFWVAEYDGVALVPPGCVAKQFAAPEGTGSARAPGHYDVSIVNDFWPGVDMTPDKEEEDHMIKIVKSDQGPEHYVLTFGPGAKITKDHIPDEYTLELLTTLTGLEPEDAPKAYLDYIADLG